MVRNQRQQAILKLISEREIDTQEGLCAALAEYGVSVTQATISRDIKDLHLVKIAGTEKKYRYGVEQVELSGLNPKMRNLFRECVVGIRAVNNLILVKTLSGNASTAGMVVDQLKLKEVMGTVAGDDTLLIVCANDKDAETLSHQLNVIREIL